MLRLTPPLLRKMGVPAAQADAWAEPLNWLRAWGVSSNLRLAHCLAQILHESQNLTRLTENLNYSAEGLLKTWPTRFTPSKAQLYARQPQAIANYVYGGRGGNDTLGDGWTYRGRGPIQTTLKDNYKALTAACKARFGPESPDYVENPDLLLEPVHGVRSAGWFWQSNGLNRWADQGATEGAVKRVGSVINTGRSDRTPHGLADRIKRFNKVWSVIEEESAREAAFRDLSCYGWDAPWDLDEWEGEDVS